MINFLTHHLHFQIFKNESFTPLPPDQNHPIVSTNLQLGNVKRAARPSRMSNPVFRRRFPVYASPREPPAGRAPGTFGRRVGGDSVPPQRGGRRTRAPPHAAGRREAPIVDLRWESAESPASAAALSPLIYRGRG